MVHSTKSRKGKIVTRLWIRFGGTEWTVAGDVPKGASLGSTGYLGDLHALVR